MLQMMQKKKEFGMNQKRILKGMQREYIESRGINIRNHQVVMDNTEVEGFETKVRIHSHPNEVGGTKGGSLGDIENAKGKDNVSFGVYFKGNQIFYEYNSRKSNVNEFKIDSLREFMKLINKMNK